VLALHKSTARQHRGRGAG